MKVEVFDKTKRDVMYLLVQLMYTLLLLAAGFLMAYGWTAMMAYMRGFV